MLASLALALFARLALAGPVHRIPPVLATGLGSANMTTFLELLSNNSDLVLPLLAAENGSTTFLAPTNQAFDVADLTNSSSSDVLAYHVLTALPTNFQWNTGGHSIVRTALNSPASVNLPNGLPQVVALGQDGVAQSTDVITPIGNSTLGNVEIFILPEVLTVPERVGQVLAPLNLSQFDEFKMNQTEGTIAVVNEFPGVTIFAPTDDAFDAASDKLQGLDNYSSTALFANHVVLGVALYSTEISDRMNVTTSAGEPLSLVSNSSGIWVQSNRSIAQIKQADVLTRNGVIHIVDELLFQTDIDPRAAASALRSASAGASTIAPTGFVPAPVAVPTASPTPAPVPSASASSSSSSASRSSISASQSTPASSSASESTSSAFTTTTTVTATSSVTESGPAPTSTGGEGGGGPTPEPSFSIPVTEPGPVLTTVRARVSA